VRAQQSAIRKIERVVHGARRVIGGNVERLKIMEVVFDFGTGCNLETRVAKNAFNTQSRTSYGM
jgi:hypothetical protein